EGRKIGNIQHHAVPPTRLLLLSVRHRSRARGAGTAEQNLRVAERNIRERGEMLVFQREPEVVRIERDRARDILHLVSDSVHALDESVRRRRWRSYAL